MAGFLIALLSGALMSVQGIFNTQVTKSTAKPHSAMAARSFRSSPQ